LNARESRREDKEGYGSHHLREERFPLESKVLKQNAKASCQKRNSLKVCERVPRKASACCPACGQVWTIFYGGEKKGYRGRRQHRGLNNQMGALRGQVHPISLLRIVTSRRES